MDMRLLPARSGRALVLTSLLCVGTTGALGQQPSDSPPNETTSARQHVLQVGAFANPANADRLSEHLRQRGIPTVTRPTSDAAGNALTLVLAGPYADEQDALRAKAGLEVDGMSGFVRTEVVAAQPPPTVPVLAKNPPDRVTNTAAARINGASADLAQDQAVLIAQANEELFEVPPVVERPLGMEEGPRVVVSRFELLGAIDRESQGLRVGDLNAMLAGHVRQQPPDGFTVNQLQSVADELTLYYRERGFFIAQAIVPAQEVRDGVVTLRILEGSLGDVRVEGNTFYKEKVVERPFAKLRGEPVTQESVEQALLDVQDFPGLTVFGTFMRGTELGSTDLVVKVREEDRFYVTPSVDNYGSEFTGEYRAVLDFTANNLFGTADQLNAYVLQTLEPDNGTYGGASLRFPFGRNAIGFGGSINQFDVGGLEAVSAVGVEGEVEQFDAYWDRTFANRRFFGLDARLGVAMKNATTEIPGFEPGETIVIAEDKLAVASLVVNAFSASRKGRGFYVGSFTVDIGMPDRLASMDGSGDGNSSRIGGDGERAGGSFEKYKFDFQHLRRLNDNNSLLLRVDGQYTNDILVSLEQYSIGGPQNVRAYPVAEALADIGTSATLEWIINAPGFADRPTRGNRTWGEIFRASLYLDYAYGKLNNPRSSEEPTVDYSGYGLGLQFNVPGKAYARVDVASPIGSRDASNDRDPQYYFRMSYTF